MDKRSHLSFMYNVGIKLLLTSLGITTKQIRDELIRLTGKNPTATNILFITTAAKLDKDPGYMLKERTRLQDTGFNVHEYDIEGKRTEELRKEINANHVIYVSGGKPFFLLKSARESGFDKLIKTLGDDKVYVGQSAGSYLVCPTLEMALWKNPNRNTYGITDFSGIGLVDFIVVSHYKEKYKELVEQKRRETNYKVYPLTDEQAISIENGKLNLIS